MVERARVTRERTPPSSRRTATRLSPSVCRRKLRNRFLRRDLFTLGAATRDTERNARGGANVDRKRVVRPTKRPENPWKNHDAPRPARCRVMCTPPRQTVLGLETRLPHDSHTSSLSSERSLNIAGFRNYANTGVSLPFGYRRVRGRVSSSACFCAFGLQLFIKREFIN